MGRVRADSKFALLVQLVGTMWPDVGALKTKGSDPAQWVLAFRDRAGEGCAVDYKQFTISVLEREPGRWRARVLRTAVVRGRAKLIQFVTETDSATAAAAMAVAMDAIDAGEFSPPIRTPSERFGRRSKGRRT